MIVMILLNISVYAEQEVEITIPDFDVVIGDQIIDNVHNKYPMILYKNITYFPMTWNFSRALGLESNWSNDTGLAIGKTTEYENLNQDLSANNDVNKSFRAEIATFDIKLNDKMLSNAEETYPILVFRNITYFPLTWKFTVDEFGWESKYNDETGLKIVNHEVTNNISIDNSINNSTNITGVNNSNIVVTNNNIDESINNSNNVTNNYSTTINNFIDNSITINNMSSNSIDELVAALTGLTSVEKNNTFIIVDQNNKPIDGAILYINNEIKGVSDSIGNLQYQPTEKNAYIRIRKTGYKEFNEELILLNSLTKTIKLEKSDTSVTNNYTGAHKELYPVYAEASKHMIDVNMLGDLFEYEFHDVSKLEIIDPDTGENVVDYWVENSWGSMNHVSFYRPMVSINSSYNSGLGLKPNTTYEITVKNHNNEKTTQLLAVLEPIVSLRGRNELSITGDYVYVQIEISSSQSGLSDVPFVLVDQTGRVVYQQTQMFTKAYQDYLEFELVDAQALKQSKHLFLRPLVESAVYQPDIETSKLDTVYDPIMLDYDDELFRRTANEYVDETIFRIYGYNISGQTYTVELQHEYKTIGQLTGTAQKSEDGLLDYIDFKIDYSTLEKGRYHIRFSEFGGFGTFNVE